MPDGYDDVIGMADYPRGDQPAEPIRCDHGKTAMESCLRCDPLNLMLWGRLPLATTLHLRERFRTYRDKG